MNIRKATINDIDELVKMRIEFLIAEHGSFTDEQIESLQKQLPLYFEKHIGNDFYAFLGEIDGCIVSSAFLIISEKPASISYVSGKIATLSNVYTKPDYRRRGISKNILELMIEETKKLDVSYIELKATKDGYRLYEKLGFEEQASKYPAMKLNFDI